MKSPLCALMIVHLALLASSYLYAWTIQSDPTAGIAPRIARFIGTLPPELTRTVDLAMLLVLFAIAEATSGQRRMPSCVGAPGGMPVAVTAFSSRAPSVKTAAPH